jgi:hypothetical protein
MVFQMLLCGVMKTFTLKGVQTIQRSTRSGSALRRFNMLLGIITRKFNDVITKKKKHGTVLAFLII